MEVRPEDLRFLDESAVEDSKIHCGKDYGEAYPEVQVQWETERANFKKMLETVEYVLVHKKQVQQILIQFFK